MKKSNFFDFVFLAAIWGASFLFMHIGASEFGPVATAGLRVSIAAIFLGPVLWFSGHWGALRERWPRIFFVGVINSGIPFMLFSYAVLSISTGVTSILNATVPLFGALVAWLWLKDRPTNLRIVGLLVGFTGVALLASSKANFQPGGTGWAILACLLAAMCYAITASFTKRHLSGVHPLAIATGSQMGAALGLAVPTIWFWPAQTPGLTPWLALLALGVVCTGVAYVLFFRLIAQAGSANALAVTFVIPLFAVFYGVLFLDEHVTSWMVICGVIIVFGTALSTGLLRFGKARTSA